MRRVWQALLAGGQAPGPSSWPKRRPELSAEQQRIREQFLSDWLTALPRKYGRLELFNQSYVLRHTPPAPWRTLEIGAGIGAHLDYEPLSEQEYTVIELREEFTQRLRRRPGLKVLVGDIQEGLPMPPGSFNRILAIHVLEHLVNLPAALAEIRRLLAPGGVLAAVIPCEGGALYELARELSTRRRFEKQYRTSYDWFVQSEHVSKVGEIIREIRNRFTISDMTYWPLRLPSITGNLVIGLTCRIDPD